MKYNKWIFIVTVMAGGFLIFFLYTFYAAGPMKGG